MSTLSQRREGQWIADRFVLGEALREWALPAVVVDADGNYLAANTAATFFTGYRRNELLGLGARGLVADERIESMLAGMNDGSLRGGETAVRTHSGTKQRVGFRIAPTRIADLTCYLVVFWAID